MCVVGRVVGVHGLRGLLRIRPSQPPAPSLAPGREVLLDDRTPPRRLRVRHASPHGGIVLVGLDGIDTRTAAEELRGVNVLVPLDELPPPGPDEFYWQELLGFVVETVGGDRVGQVAGTMTTGLHDVWIVREGEREHLLPVVAEVVREIDRAGRRIVITPLPGLLE